MKSLVKEYKEEYALPNMCKITLEAVLIFAIVIGAIILSYRGKMDNTITAILFAVVLGFCSTKLDN